MSMLRDPRTLRRLAPPLCVVPAIVVPPDQDRSPQPACHESAALRSEVQLPEAQAIPGIHTRHAGRIEELCEVFHLPAARCPRVIVEPVQIDNVDLTLPRGQLSSQCARNVQVAQVQILVEATAAVERTDQ